MGKRGGEEEERGGGREGEGGEGRGGKGREEEGKGKGRMKGGGGRGEEGRKSNITFRVIKMVIEPSSPPSGGEPHIPGSLRENFQNSII